MHLAVHAKNVAHAVQETPSHESAYLLTHSREPKAVRDAINRAVQARTAFLLESVKLRTCHKLLYSQETELSGLITRNKIAKTVNVSKEAVAGTEDHGERTETTGLDVLQPSK